MTNAKPTPGPWELAEKFNCVDVRAANGAYVANANQSAHIDWSTKEANARLIAEAGTVHHETGLTPRELMEQRAELIEALEKVRKWGGILCRMPPDMWIMIDGLITRAKERADGQG